MNRRAFLRLMGCATAASIGPALLNAPGAGSEPCDARAALLYDDIYRKHRTGENQPECPDRYDAVMRSLGDLRSQLKRLSPRPATLDEILLCHDPAYVAVARRDSATSDVLSTGDTFLCPDSFTVALQAAGGAMVAVDHVMTSSVRRAFCVVRPPGHHASSRRGMGFCIFNNAAIAARYAQRRYGVGKVAIVDWDVHHGNGTQDIFYSDGSVFFFSTHQHPWFPGTGHADETGSGKGRGCILNCPLPAGSGHQEVVVRSFQDRLLPALDRFKPELVIISAGFDAREGDPLGRFRLQDSDFTLLTKMVLDAAARHAHGRVVSVLEGGYSLTGLARGARAHVEALMV